MHLIAAWVALLVPGVAPGSIATAATTSGTTPSQSAPATAPATPAAAPSRGLAEPPATPLPPLPPVRCKVAVFDLPPGRGYSAKTASAISDAVTAEVAKYSNCGVLSRSEIRAILSFEAEQQLLGCNDESCLATLAGALGVDFLVSGSLSKVGNNAVLTLRNVNLRTLTVERRLTDTFSGADDDLVGFSGWMARRLYLDDNRTGAKPIARAQSRPGMSIWRVLAWSGAGLTATAAVTTLAAAATTYSLSNFLNTAKSGRGYDPKSITDAERVGPIAASIANLGLYATAALLVPTIVFFFLPAHSTENQVGEPVAAAAGAAAENRP